MQKLNYKQTFESEVGFSFLLFHFYLPPASYFGIALAELAITLNFNGFGLAVNDSSHETNVFFNGF